MAKVRELEEIVDEELQRRGIDRDNCPEELQLVMIVEGYEHLAPDSTNAADLVLHLTQPEFALVLKRSIEATFEEDEQDAR